MHSCITSSSNGAGRSDAGASLPFNVQVARRRPRGPDFPPDSSSQHPVPEGGEVGPDSPDRPRVDLVRDEALALTPLFEHIPERIDEYAVTPDDDALTGPCAVAREEVRLVLQGPCSVEQ